MFVRMCVHVCAHVCAHVCVCARVGVRVCARMRVRGVGNPLVAHTTMSVCALIARTLVYNPNICHVNFPMSIQNTNGSVVLKVHSAF